MRSSILMIVAAGAMALGGCTASDYLYAIHQSIYGSAYQGDEYSDRMTFEEHYRQQTAMAKDYYENQP